MKLTLFVEGSTEKSGLPSFLKRWLDPRLPLPVGIKVVQFQGVGAYYEKIEFQANWNLSEGVGADIIAGIGILDLNGLSFCPKHLVTTKERYSWAKEHLELKVGHPRFRQHFAVHETEAWLLAHPEILPAGVRRALPGKASHPENVNFDEPPAKLLERLYREKVGRRYKKVLDGASLFKLLSPDRAYEKCPALKALLDDMLSLAQQALR